MEEDNTHISLSNPAVNSGNQNQAQDYSEILDSYGLNYKSNQYYWQVGEIKKTQGWILHLSVIKLQLVELLNLVIPELTEKNIPFKIARNFETAGDLLEGSLGYINLGKLICIYENNEQYLPKLAKQLIDLTQHFKGPAIPTDRHLGSIVYTRYGSFRPLIQKNANGESVKFIYNEDGKLAPDPYNIPFSFPSGQTWPFTEIINSSESKRPKLLNYAYYPLIKLKLDVKGDVTKALYFRHFWLIRPCLIKQGRRYMAMDNAGRDIRDKLKWQYEVYHELSGKIPMPKVFDFFEEKEDSYLTMEYIDGISLTAWINLAFKSRRWIDLPPATQRRLIDRLLEVVRIVKRLHECGFIHRDLTPENFLINKKKRIYLIDMELAWSIHSKKPNPPHRLGTLGFMSPEQFRTERPTVKEDIYALGSLMLMFFTNLYPSQFFSADKSLLKTNLKLFIPDETICELISNCLQIDPHERPSTAALLGVLEEYAKQIQTKGSEDGVTTSIAHKNKIEYDELNHLIQVGIDSLADSYFLAPNNCWVSKMQKQDKYIGNAQQEMALYEGWYIGMAGPLWLIARAKYAGFDIKLSERPYQCSWNYLKTHYFAGRSGIQLGLFSGSAGIVMALVEAINSGLIQFEDGADNLLLNCFREPASTLDLSTGKAGQGIALLNSLPWLMDNTKIVDLLRTNVNTIHEFQNKDGSWNLNTISGKQKDYFFGLNKGIVGIVWFLLAYVEYTPDPSVDLTIIKALDWIIKHASKKGGSMFWAVSTKSHTIDAWTSGEGMPGIILCLIRAYKHFKEPFYREIAEKVLWNLPIHPIRQDFTLGEGLPGLGEIYLEAYRVFEDAQWERRANWLVQILMHTFQTRNNRGYWLTNSNSSVTADLGTGISGILHFLIRYQSAGIFRHPLSPSTYKL